jgi:hypothetical protein
MKSSVEKPRRASAVLSSAGVSTPFSLRDMARVRLPKLSTELLAVVSCRESVLTTVPYLSNSVLMAPRNCRTSLDRFCSASDRKPSWTDVNRVLPPVSVPSSPGRARASPLECSAEAREIDDVLRPGRWLLFRRRDTCLLLPKPLHASVRRAPRQPCLELLAVSAVVDPVARSRDPLPRGNALRLRPRILRRF